MTQSSGHISKKVRGQSPKPYRPSRSAKTAIELRNFQITTSQGCNITLTNQGMFRWHELFVEYNQKSIQGNYGFLPPTKAPDLLNM